MASYIAPQTGKDLEESHRAATHVLSLPPKGNDTELAGNGSIFFIGNATVIIKYAGFIILTDPNFLHAGEHAHLGYGIEAVRVTNPAIELHELPPIDFIVLSHLHEDHWDREVEAKIDKNIPIVSTSHAVHDLGEKGFKRLFPLQTWEKLIVVRESSNNYVTLTSMPGNHNPQLISPAHLLPPVMGSLLEFGTNPEAGKHDPSYRIYISGDTLVYDDLKEIPMRFPTINLGLFHLGGTTLPMGLVVTMDAKQGIEAIRIINPHNAIPIHYNDYDRFLSTLDDFKKAVKEASMEDKVHYLTHGDTYEFAVKKA